MQAHAHVFNGRHRYCRQIGRVRSAATIAAHVEFIRFDSRRRQRRPRGRDLAAMSSQLEADFERRGLALGGEYATAVERWEGPVLLAGAAGAEPPAEVHLLTFADEQLEGEGRDCIGEFLFKGRYSLEIGECHFTKRYIGQHDVFYRGFNEGKGIWGVWEIQYRHVSGATFSDKGGFHIWPEGMADPTQQTLKNEEPIPEEDLLLV